MKRSLNALARDKNLQSFVQSLVGIPLVFGEQLIGMLSVRIAANRQIDEEDLEFAQMPIGFPVLA